MQNKTRIGFALVGFLIFFTIFNVDRNSDNQIRFKVSGDTAYVNGSTNSLSYGVVRSFLNDNPEVKKFVLRNMPGTVDSMENLRIARLMRKRGIETHLESYSRIASGAVDLFIAGAKRSMECGALIGVHSWSIDGHIGPKDIGRDSNQPVHETFLKEMGIDPQFYVFTREAADPEEIYFLSAGEIKRFGLLTVPANCPA